MKWAVSILVMCGLVSSIAAYNLCDQYTVEGFSQFSTLMAICYCFVSWALYLKVTVLRSWEKVWVSILLSCACANLFDELFLDPTLKEPQEYILAFLMAFYLITKNRIS